MRSAPARRIAVRISSTARVARRSSRAAAAALTIAYSPLTLYAASGTSKRAAHGARSRRGTGSAGFTMTHVGALGHVERRLAQRLARVGRIHLVAAPVAELRAPTRRPRGTGRRTPTRTSPRRTRIGVVGSPRRRARRGSRRRGRPSCRSGATTSAPASAWRRRPAARSSSVRVVVDLARRVDDAAVAVVRCTRRGRRR